MSDKLKQFSKVFFATFLAAQLVACSDPPPDFNTEIVCPNGAAILVKFIRAKDLREAITTAYADKKALRTSENYTPVRLKDGRSFVLKDFPPEVASSCDLVESEVGKADPSYIHHF